MGRLNEVVLTGIVDEEKRELVRVSANGMDAKIPTVETNPLTGGVSFSVSARAGVAGLKWDDTSVASANRQIIQTELDKGGHVVVHGAKDHTLYIDSSLIEGDNTIFDVVSGTLTQVGPQRMSIIRVGNLEIVAAKPRGLIPLCADTGVAQNYTCRIVKSGGAITLQAGAGGTFGATVSIAGPSAKFGVVAPDGRTLYVRTVSAQLPTVDGTYDVPMYATPRNGANPITFARVSGTTTVAEVGHGRVDKDVVTFLGNANLDGTFFITVEDADTYTVSDARADASGAAKAYAVNNVEVNFKAGAKNISGDAADATAAHVCGNQFPFVNGLKISGTFKVLTGGKYCGIFQAVTRLDVTNVVFDETASDGFTQIGPMDRVKVRGSSGTCHDNMFGMGTSNSDNLLYIAPGEAGTRDYLSADIEDVTSDGGTQELFRLFGSAGAKHGNIKIRRVRGKSHPDVGMFLWAFYDPMTLSATAGAVDHIDLGDIVWGTTPGKLMQAIRIQGANQTVKRITLDGIDMSWDSSGLTLVNTPCLVSINAANVSNVEVKKSKLTGSATGSALRLVNIESAAPVPNCIVIDDCDLTQVENLYKTYASSAASNAQFIAKNLRMTSCAYVASPASITGSQSFVFENITSTGLINLMVTGATTGNFSIFGSGLYLCNARTINYTSTGANIRVKSFEIECDVTKLQRTNGSHCYNTNAAAGTLAAAGMVACDGSGAAGSWKLVTNPSLNY